MRLRRESALLLIIDVQERLMPVIDDGAAVEKNIIRLIQGAHVLAVPTMLTEQYPRGLGSTTQAVRKALDESSGYAPLEKSCFSAWGCVVVRERLETLARRQIVVAGVEAHVCVYQTVADLLDAGHEVIVLADAVSSRTAQNRSIAVGRMAAEGATIGSTEMALFELTRAAGTDEFRAISRLVK